MGLKDLEQYVRSYNKSIYRLMSNGRCAPSDKQWTAFESAIDFEFPKDFREFSQSILGGLSVEVYEELWSRPTQAEVGQEWKNQYSVNVFGVGFGVPKWLDLRERLNSLPPEETDIVPFMALGGEPELYCFDLDHQVVFWTPSNGHRKVIEQDFFTLLMAEITELEKRYQKYDKVGRPKKKRSRKKA